MAGSHSSPRSVRNGGRFWADCASRRSVPNVAYDTPPPVRKASSSAGIARMTPTPN
jgi:hypothetical protein